MTTKTFAYVRVSSKEQNINRQLDTMRSLGIDERDMFIDKASGKDTNREKYQALKSIVREGDTVVFDSITRLSRNMNDIKKEYEWFTTNKINLQFVKEPMLNTTNDKTDVMKQAINDIILTLLGAFAQQERENIKQRQKEGIESAKARGKHLGRPKATLTKEQQLQFEKLYTKWKANEITATAMMHDLDMKRTTFYKIIKEHEANQI